MHCSIRPLKNMPGLFIFSIIIFGISSKYSLHISGYTAFFQFFNKQMEVVWHYAETNQFYGPFLYYCFFIYVGQSSALTKILPELFYCSTNVQNLYWSLKIKNQK